MPSTLSDPAYRAFVLHLVALRRRAGVSQAELASRMGKRQSYVSKIERYERRIDPAEFWVLASALGVDAREAYAAVLEGLEAAEPEG